MKAFSSKILFSFFLFLITTISANAQTRFYFVAVHCTSKANTDTTDICKESFYTSVFSTPRPGMEYQIRKQIAQSFESTYRKIAKKCNCNSILPEVHGPYSSINGARYEMDRLVSAYQYLARLHFFDFFFIPDKPNLDDDQNYFLFPQFR